MRVLIVGGTRFLGSAIARELVRRGHDVAVFHRGQTEWGVPSDVRHVLGDARDRAFVETTLRDGAFDAVVDTILHAADLAWYLPLLKQYAGQLVHCGSTGVYAPASHCPVHEDDPTPCPPELGGFGEKLEQDKALLRFHEETGFKTVSLRVSNVFGAGDVPLDAWGARSPAFFQRVADGKEVWVPERGLPLLQPVHTEDLARGFAAALESGQAAGEVYNLTSERAVTLRHYVGLIRELLQSRSPVKYVTCEDILATGKANEGGLRFLCEHMSIDASKAARELEYTPRISVREGLRESLEWMVSSGQLTAAVA